MNGIVLPAINARRTDETVAGDGGRPLFTSRFDAENAVGTVLIVHGFTENADKFAELIHSLLHCGFSVLAYAQRGHGRSWRAPGLAENSVTHVDDFDEYVRDMEIVVQKRLSAMPKPWFLFAHSMGGAVSSLFLERHGGVFRRVALCAPMIAPNLNGLPAWAARLMCGGAGALGRSKKRIPFSRPYSGPEDFKTSCATDQNRFNWYDSIKHSHKEFRNSVPSYRWSVEAIKVTKEILRPNAPEKIACPVLLCSADCDDSVLHAPQEQFIHRVPKGVYLFVPDSKHEIYRSVNTVLFPWWHQVLEFLTSNLSHS
jgi:lysophospholipase